MRPRWWKRFCKQFFHAKNISGAGKLYFFGRVIIKGNTTPPLSLPTKGIKVITNRIAISLGVMIVVFFIADGVIYDWQMSLFLGRKFAALTEYIKFWR